MFVITDFQEPKDLFSKEGNFFEKNFLEKSKRRKFSFSFLLLFLLFFLPFIFLGGNFLFFFFQVKRLENSFRRFDFLAVKNNALTIEKNIERGISFLEIPASFTVFLDNGEEFRRIQNVFFMGKATAKAIGSLSEIFLETEEIFKKIISGEKVDEERWEYLRLAVDDSFKEVSYAQALLDQFSGNEFLVGSYFLKAKKIFPEIRKNLVFAREITKVLPSIFGVKERKTYLILFQNNMEIRPTGGFIGSFGILTFEGGRLLDFEVHDVYFADGQLKGHVEPPLKIKEILGEAGWYLRDSNWDPDFPISARRAAWFLNKEIGRKVDGVIGVDLFFAQRILEAIGEIYLPDYQEKINAVNFFEKAEYFSEAGFFPGSTGKQDFLGQTVRILFEKIKEADRERLFLIGQAFLTSLEEKDIIIFLDDESSFSLIKKFNWDGGIKSVSCQENDCFKDYLMVNEANLGVNKSNYFLKRSLRQKTSISKEGEVLKELKIDYENQSPDDVFPAGRYKSYLRIYVPQGATLKECKIDEKDCQVEETIEHQRTVFGFLLEVPVKEKKTVEISWVLPFLFKGREYAFLFQKQPGAKNEELTISFSYPENFIFESSQPIFLTEGQEIIYNTNLSNDKIFRIKFLKND
jgi:hypothetical protein